MCSLLFESIHIGAKSHSLDDRYCSYCILIAVRLRYIEVNICTCIVSVYVMHKTIRLSSQNASFLYRRVYTLIGRFKSMHSITNLVYMAAIVYTIEPLIVSAQRELLLLNTHAYFMQGYIYGSRIAVAHICT